ncbi:MAG: metallophosphoesterase family protein [Bacillota bacterium]|nr:metallophosphoesterase family protein [Bacillota bacterium]
MQEVKYNLKKNGFIGIVSDTHVPVRALSLPGQLFTMIDGADLILHAGDLEEESVLDELRNLAPVEAVAGNMDPVYLKAELGIKKIIHLGGISLGLIHGSGMPRGVPDFALRHFLDYKIQGLIFGHSHVPYLEYREGMLLLNPGSAGAPRRGEKPSCARIWVEGKHLRGEIIYL